MPIYEYSCKSCQERFDSIRPMSQRDEPATCPGCGGLGERQVSAFGSKYEGHYFTGAKGERRRTDPHD